MKPVLKIWTWLAAVSLLLAACVSRAPASTEEATDANPNAVFTAAAETAQAMMTQMAATTPTEAPATPTQPAPTTEAAAAPETTSGAPLTGTQPVPSTQAIGGTTPVAPPAGGGTTPAAPPAGGVSTQGNLAEFVQDVTVPDGTDVDPGERFVKTWRLKNAGTTTWTTDFEVIFSSGSQMEAPASVPMPTTVEPGGTVDISVNFVAPNDAGEYYSYWLMQDAAGSQFGLAPAGNAPFYVQIQVGGASGDTDEEDDTTPTDTAEDDDDDDADSNVSAGGLSGVAVSIDEPIVSGECPHTFAIAASFNLSSPGTVTYKLEGGTDDPNFPLNLPSPVTANAKTGKSTNYFTMKFESSVSGWVQLHVTEPDDVLSNRLNFSLTCGSS